MRAQIKRKQAKMSQLINVTFIDITTGITLGIYEVPLEQLPKSFEAATTLNMGGSDWSIEDAEPKTAEEFIKSGQLTLKMRQLKKVNPKDVLFSLPTIAGDIPTNTSPDAAYNDFIFTLHEDSWRQYEFLRPQSSETIQFELSKIKEVKEKYNQKVDDSLTAYTNCHLRKTIGEPQLNIDFDQLKALLLTKEAGSFALKGYEGFVPGGFTLKTNETTYYGIINDQHKVTLLGIANFSENTINEIKFIIQAFGLVFIDWCNEEIIEDRSTRN
ncbi:hypothetical protein BKI52_10190 [marine bacterium AO1-C]|nr:hypothetical protein BKI52_10190 [marine bacterium AO1-C]